jgi:xanthine dehydrogenase accessory factor
MKVWSTIATAIEAQGTCALVSLVEVEGSAPREPGARLIVTPHGFHGTIGGGALEWRAIAEAQARLGNGASVNLVTQALGPELGQCCGGRVRLLTEVFDRSMLEGAKSLAAQEAKGPFSTEAVIGADRVERRLTSRPRGGRPPHWIEHFGEERRPVYLFGAGHVGRALVLAMAPLRFAVTWIDSRPDAFPGAVPGNIKAVFSASPGDELATAPDLAFILVMTHSHALDLAIVERAMREARFGYVGLIGSATKRARFVARLRAGGIPENRIADLVCPIGVSGITGKEPAVIAAATVAELLQRDELLRRVRNPLAAGQEPSKMAAGRA